MKHVHVNTKGQLQDALFTSQREDVDCIVEVESEIDTNVAFHRLSAFDKLTSPNKQGITFFPYTDTLCSSSQ